MFKNVNIQNKKLVSIWIYCILFIGATDAICGIDGSLIFIILVQKKN